MVFETIFSAGWNTGASLLGLKFYDQFAVYDPGANAFNFAFTRGGIGQVGGL